MNSIVKIKDQRWIEMYLYQARKLATDKFDNKELASDYINTKTYIG